jgi:hypothetical protein
MKQREAARVPWELLGASPESGPVHPVTARTAIVRAAQTEAVAISHLLSPECLVSFIGPARSVSIAGFMRRAANDLTAG